MGNSRKKSRPSMVFSAVMAATVTLSLLVGFAVSPAVAADTKSLNDIVAAAKQEGSVTLYSTASDTISQALARGFERQYGIKANVLRLVTTDLVARFASEAAAGVHNADVVLIGVTKLFETSPKLFRPYGDMPNAMRLLEAARETKITVIAAMDEQTVVWNTSTVKDGEQPKTWEDILNPRWKGRCVLLDPRQTPVYLFWAKTMRDNYGDGFLTKLAAQNCRLADSGVTGSQQVAAGAADIVVPPVPAHAMPLISKGAPLAIQTMPKLNVGSQQRIALPADSKRPNAGWLFMNWILSTEGQLTYCTGIYASLDPDAKGCWKLPPNYIPGRSDIAKEEAATILKLLGLPG